VKAFFFQRSSGSFVGTRAMFVGLTLVLFPAAIATLAL